MPFRPVETVKCPKCTKSVYAAEQILAAGNSFHKMCFTCGLCKKMLEPNTVTNHEENLYCKTCYGRKYGPKGVGFGGGAGCMTMDTGAQFNNTETTT
jgi:cysteine/glycine-rich protein